MEQDMTPEQYATAVDIMIARDADVERERAAEWDRAEEQLEQQRMDSPSGAPGE